MCKSTMAVFLVNASSREFHVQIYDDGAIGKTKQLYCLYNPTLCTWDNDWLQCIAADICELTNKPVPEGIAEGCVGTSCNETQQRVQLVSD